MSRFTGPLAVTFLDAKSGLAHLDQPLVWELGEKGSGREVVVPRGFVSDGVSAPRIFWSFLSPWGSPATRPAILHDYAQARLRAGHPIPGLETPKKIDAVFREALIACGYTERTASALWGLVRGWTLTVPFRQRIGRL